MGRLWMLMRPKTTRTPACSSACTTASPPVGCSLTPASCRSHVALHAAGHVERGAGDVAGLPRGEKGDRRGHLLGLAEPPQRDAPLGGQLGEPGLLGHPGLRLAVAAVPLLA